VSGQAFPAPDVTPEGVEAGRRVIADLRRHADDLASQDSRAAVRAAVSLEQAAATVGLLYGLGVFGDDEATS
jgi:hypothetical protein